MASPELWPQLATAALLGTVRAGACPELDGPLGACMQARQAANPEDTFLAAAAAWDLYRRAGILPGPAGASADEALPDERPRTSAAADGHLARLLEGNPENVLPEWLALCAHRGKRVWERHIPALLEAAAREESLRATVQQVVGQRGTWLATQNPDWRTLFAAATDDASLWETGTRVQRQGMLRQMRQREPATARQTLEKAWTQAPPEERATFMAILADGLSMADEPFLESALDDKRKEVRTIAADFLARLPESRLTLRMIERARGLVSIEAAARGKIMKALAGAGKSRLVVNLPEKVTREMERDGVTGKPAIRGLGEKAWALATILAAVPPAVWTAGTERTPSDIIALLTGQEFELALWAGWSMAAMRHRDAIWADSLIRYWLAAPKIESVDGEPIIRELLTALPPDQREQLTTDALATEWETLEDNVRLAMLKTCSHAWSVPFSRAVLTALRRHAARQKNVYQYAVRQAMEAEFGRCLAPAMAAGIADGWPADAPESLQRAIETMISTVQFRHDMHKELSP